MNRQLTEVGVDTSEQRGTTKKDPKRTQRSEKWGFIFIQQKVEFGGRMYRVEEILQGI